MSEKIRILHVNMSIDPVTGGGTAERIFQLSRYMSKQGTFNKVLTTSLGVNLKRLKDLQPVEVVVLPLLWTRFYLPYPQFSKVAESVRWADFIHIMGHWTILNAWVYLLCRMYQKPYAVCPAGALPIFGRSRYIKKIYNILVGKRMIRNAQVHLAITQGELPAYESYGIQASRIKIIPNGVEKSTYRQDHQILNRAKLDRPYILFMGRMNLIKGPDLLAEAFVSIAHKYPDIDLVFAGPDEGMVQKVKDISVDSGLENRVRYIGYIGGEDKQVVMHESLLFVIPSRHDAMSIVALEASVQGVAVLITDQCGFNEIGNHGGLVVPTSVEGLRSGLELLLSDREQLVQRGSDLKKFAETNYSWNSIAIDHIKAFVG